MKSQIVEGRHVNPKEFDELLSKVFMVKGKKVDMPTTIMKPGGQTVTANKGDYIILDINGEFDVLPANLVELNYNPVEYVVDVKMAPDGKTVISKKVTDVIDVTKLDAHQIQFLMDQNRKLNIEEIENPEKEAEEPKAGKEKLEEKIVFQAEDEVPLSKIKKDLLSDMAKARELEFEYRKETCKTLAKMIVEHDVAKAKEGAAE